MFVLLFAYLRHLFGEVPHARSMDNHKLRIRPLSHTATYGSAVGIRAYSSDKRQSCRCLYVTNTILNALSCLSLEGKRAFYAYVGDEQARYTDK